MKTLFNINAIFLNLHMQKIKAAICGVGGGGGGDMDKIVASKICS